MNNDLANDWQVLMASLVVHRAGGGKVKNTSDAILFIYRNGRWDLPKGKLESNESIENCALREVEEECGVTSLSIEHELETTYHIFKRKGQLILKITHWFEMRTGHTGTLQPQAEEGITAVSFKEGTALQSALEETYETIKLLF